MAGYLCKYVGTYRVLAEYDRGTNDWVRDEFGNYDESFDDFYIPLKNNYGRILHYDEDILIIHIIGGRKAQDVLRQIKEDNHVKNLISSGLALKIIELDGEILIYIKEENLSKYTKYINPSTYGAKIKPFDSKNLPKPNKVPRGELKKFEQLKQQVGSKGAYRWANLTRQFIFTNCHIGIKELRQTGLNFCNFIYQNNLWEKYLTFLSKNIK